MPNAKVEKIPLSPRLSRELKLYKLHQLYIKYDITPDEYEKLKAKVKGY